MYSTLLMTDTALLLELLGFVLNLIYLYEVIRQRKQAWLWSILACGIFALICFKNNLLLQSGLYVFYMAIAVYGYMQWNRDTASEVRMMSANQHLKFILLCSSFGVLFGYVFEQFTLQFLPYLDGLITAFAVGTTFLIVLKIKENWIYWMFINAASVYLYYSQELYLMTATSLMLLMIALRGYLVWDKNRSQVKD